MRADYALLKHDEPVKKGASMTTATWIADSGASTHMGNDDEGMYDAKLINSPVKMGNGITVTAKKIGKKRVSILQQDGTTTDVVLEDFKYVPNLCVNLFSITKALHKGWNIGNKGVQMYLQKNDQRIVFDKEFKTQKGAVWGVKILPRTSQSS